MYDAEFSFQYRCHVGNCASLFDLSSKFLHHLNSVHLLNHQTVVCPFKACTYTTFDASSFKAHKSRMHSHISPKDAFKECILVRGSLPGTSGIRELNSNDSDAFDVEFPAHDNDCMETESPDEISDIVINRLANFLLQLQVLDGVSFETIQRVVNEINELSSITLNTAKIACKKLLLENSLSQDVIESVLSCFDSNEIQLVVGPNGPLSTHKRRQSYFKSQLPHVEPVDVKLAGLHHCTYVPLLEDLRTFLSKDDVARIAFAPVAPFEGIYREFSDGSIYRNHLLFSNEPHSVQINLFTDAFTTGNPLGVRKKATKLDAIYCISQNSSIKYKIKSLLDFSYIGSKFRDKKK